MGRRLVSRGLGRRLAGDDSADQARHEKPLGNEGPRDQARCGDSETELSAGE